MAQQINETRVRQGENSSRMPIVLGLSVFLILVGFSGFFAYNQLFAPQQSSHSSFNSAGK